MLWSLQWWWCNFLFLSFPFANVSDCVYDKKCGVIDALNIIKLTKPCIYVTRLTELRSHSSVICSNIAPTVLVPGVYIAESSQFLHFYSLTCHCSNCLPRVQEAGLLTQDLEVILVLLESKGPLVI